jgi:hypothetical protein
MKPTLTILLLSLSAVAQTPPELQPIALSWDGRTLASTNFTWVVDPTALVTNDLIIAPLLRTLSTNWLTDPTSAAHELGIVYSNITAQVVWKNVTNEVRLESTPVGFAGRRNNATIAVTNSYHDLVITNSNDDMLWWMRK